MLEKIKEKYKYFINIHQIYIVYKMIPIIAILALILTFSRNELVTQLATIASFYVAFMVSINCYFAVISYQNQVYHYNQNANYHFKNYFSWSYVRYLIGAFFIMIILSGAILTHLSFYSDVKSGVNDNNFSFRLIGLFLITAGFLKYLSFVYKEAKKEYKMLQPNNWLVSKILNHKLIDSANFKDIISVVNPDEQNDPVVGFILKDFRFDTSKDAAVGVEGLKMIDTCYYKNKLISFEVLMNYLSENNLFFDKISEDEMLVFEMFDYS